MSDVNPEQYSEYTTTDGPGSADEDVQSASQDLRETFKRFEPTHRDLARVNGAIAERRDNLRRLIEYRRALARDRARARCLEHVQIADLLLAEHGHYLEELTPVAADLESAFLALTAEPA